MKNLSEYLDLRKEIEIQNILAPCLSIGTLVLMIWVALSTFPVIGSGMYLLPIIGIGWIFSVARSEALIHRVGAHLYNHYESRWERSKEREHANWIIGASDLGSTLPIFFGFAAGVAYTHELGNRPVIAMFETLLFLAGLALSIYANSTYKAIRTDE